MRSRLLTALLGVSLLCSGLAASPLPAVAATVDAATSVAAVSPSRRWIGFYQPGAPSHFAPLGRTMWAARSPAKVCSYFTQAPLDPFNVSMASSARSHGVIPMITLEFGSPANGVNQPKYSMGAVVSGSFDDYLRDYARSAKAYGGPVWLRPFHEMNGNWYPWCGTVNGNTPEKCAAAWRHVRGIFREEGATNVLFVWSPNADSAPWPNGPRITAYWPGDDYVDIIGLDGFNFGAGKGMSWRSFERIFGPRGALDPGPYREVCRLSASKPIIVAETGCTAKGGDKAKWISDMFKVIPLKFPRIVGVVWFNANKDRDWRMDSSSASRQAFVAGSSGYQWINKTSNSVSIKTSKKSTRRGKAFTLSGYLKAGRTGDRVRVEVKKPGSSAWKLSSMRTLSGSAWRYKFKPGRKGTYRFRVRYFGDYRRKTATSRTIKVVVR